ncbi:MAG: hypothetical protein ACXAEU_25945 [Candidatus Hodarchaeales archaeon]
MPIDKEKLNGLLEEIKRLEKESLKKHRKYVNSTPITTREPVSHVKKAYLLPTEKKAYFEISHHYKLTMLYIEDTGTALAIWLKGILPLLLTKHGLDNEEWERICDIGDRDSRIEEELEIDWKEFFQKIVKEELIDERILSLINEGKERVKKMLIGQ